MGRVSRIIFMKYYIPPDKEAPGGMATAFPPHTIPDTFFSKNLSTTMDDTLCLVRSTIQLPMPIHNRRRFEKVVLTASSALKRSAPDRLPAQTSSYGRNTTVGSRQMQTLRYWINWEWSKMVFRELCLKSLFCGDYSCFEARGNSSRVPFNPFV